MRRPCIVVSGPNDGGGAAWRFTAAAIRRAGGSPRRATPARPTTLDGAHGLVLGGGADVDPALYGETAPSVAEAVREAATLDPASPGRRAVYPLVLMLRRLGATRRPPGSTPGSRGDTARDALETGLLDEALARGLPVLGICRGEQLLNVHLGGTLHQDTASFYVETPRLRTVLPRKLVDVDPGSRLAAILGCTRCAVNALHRQAVRDLGRGLTVAARERNGVVQAIEDRSRRFLLGVQWHPEYLPQLPTQRRLFAALVAAARAALPAPR